MGIACRPLRWGNWLISATWLNYHSEDACGDEISLSCRCPTRLASDSCDGKSSGRYPAQKKNNIKVPRLNRSKSKKLAATEEVHVELGKSSERKGWRLNGAVNIVLGEQSSWRREVRARQLPSKFGKTNEQQKEEKRGKFWTTQFNHYGPRWSNHLCSIWCEYRWLQNRIDIKCPQV